MECSGGILITIEGWGVNLAGCYGNSLLPTPNLDRIAAHGIVFDQFWMNSVELPSNINSILDGIQPNRWLCATDSKTAATVLRQYEDLDRLEVAQVQGVESFECLLTEALECWLEQRRETPFLWIHSRGLSGDWDAPYEYRKLMCDDEDPVPPTETIPPNRVLPLDFDPDLLFGLSCGAGAQSVCIDQGIGFLLHSIKELGIDQECWIALAGLLGFPLGEHRRIGLGKRLTSAGDGQEMIADAYAERLHTPWIIRPAPEMNLGVRNPCILQPDDLGAWLEHACDGIAVHGYEFFRDGAQVAWATGVEEIALITERWSARFDLVAGSSGTSCLDQSKQGEVYCFPEDRWQQNQVASRVPGVESLLRQIASILLDPHGFEACNSDELTKLLSELSEIRR